MSDRRVCIPKPGRFDDRCKTYIEVWKQLGDMDISEKVRSVDSSIDDIEDEQLPKEELSPEKIFEKCTTGADT